MEKVCIICTEKKDGYPIEDTQIIRLIRKVKRKFSIAQNNKLVVCKEHLEDYKKKRQDFEKRVIVNGILGALFFAIAFFIPLLSGRLDITSFFVALVLTGFLMLLSLLIYIPPLEKEHMDRLTNKADKDEGHKEQTKRSHHHKTKAHKSHHAKRHTHKKKK